MKRTVRIVALAAPLATAALALGATPAVAEIGPDDRVTVPIDRDPIPRPDIPEEDPQDDPERPDGPGEITDKDPCPTHGECGDGPDDKDGPGDGDEPGDKDEPGDEIKKPNRIDAGTGSQDGLDLAWLMAGGALITASGVAMAARRRPLTEA